VGLYRSGLAIAAEINAIRTLDTVSTFARSSPKLRQDAHALYIDGVEDGITTFKEFRGIP